MKQARTKLRQNAAKRRREYLLQKTKSYSLAYTGLIVFITFIVATPCLVFVIHLIRLSQGQETNGRDLTGQEMALYGLLLLIPISIAFLGNRLYRSSIEKANAIAYVPPAHEEVGDLLAEEVLLRGSVEPAASPDELVRAAKYVEEIPANELLRAEQGVAGRQGGR